MWNMDFLHVLQILLLRSARNEKKVREKRSLHVSKLQEKSLKASLQASQAGVYVYASNIHEEQQKFKFENELKIAQYNIAAAALLPLTLGF